MPYTPNEIHSYDIIVNSDTQPNGRTAIVNLYGAGGEKIVKIAALEFYPPGSPHAITEFKPQLGFPVVSYPSTALASVVDVLRNEKPVYFTWCDVPPDHWGSLGTRREPVGEAEGP
jgi:hypothetical protein